MSELDKLKAAAAADKTKVVSLWAKYWPVVAGIGLGAFIAKVFL